jgi:hypothetical protein
MRPLGVAVSSLILLLVPASLVAQDQTASQTKTVCVAEVANASTTSAFVERMTERLAKSLKQNKLQAVTMDSRTTMDRRLHLSTQNGEEARQKDCDYIVLTQIRDPGSRPWEPQAPDVSIGGPVPSVDAADPMTNGPVHRENLQVAFALFRRGEPKPLLETNVLERPSANVSDSLLPAMDHEANRVGHELKKH